MAPKALYGTLIWAISILQSRTHFSVYGSKVLELRSACRVVLLISPLVSCSACLITWVLPFVVWLWLVRQTQPDPAWWGPPSLHTSCTPQLHPGPLHLYWLRSLHCLIFLLYCIHVSVGGSDVIVCLPFYLSDYLCSIFCILLLYSLCIILICTITITPSISVFPALWGLGPGRL